MSSRLSIISLISSLVFTVLAGVAIVVILTVPALANNQAQHILIAVAASLVVSPIISWFIAAKMQSR